MLSNNDWRVLCNLTPVRADERCLALMGCVCVTTMTCSAAVPSAEEEFLASGTGTEAFAHEHIHSADHVLSAGHDPITLPKGLPRPDHGGSHRHHPDHGSAYEQHDAHPGGATGLGEGSFSGARTAGETGEGGAEAKYTPHPVLAEILRVSLASQVGSSAA